MEILLPCPLCFKPHFHGVDSLRSSLISAATSHLTCPVCNETLLGLDKLTIHLFSHISDNNKMNQGNNDIQGEKEINESINSMDKSLVESVEDQIKCDICNFTFRDRSILDMHQKLLHQTSPDKNTGQYSYHCHLCSKKFKKRGSLMVHLRVAHYGFGARSSDNDHIDTDLSNQNLTFTPTSDQIKIHEIKQWECEVCSKTFTTKYFLKKHKRLHTGEMPYFCAQCNKSFTFQQSYHKHMLYHSSEKPHVCSECGRAFKELSTLQNHARIHSGERPFGCETCGKRFRQRVSYLVHQRIHTGVMPYKCTACDKTFRYKVSQRSHKCPIVPPGLVLRVNEPEKSIKPPQEVTITNEVANVKCIMSVDYNTGNINIIENEAIFMQAHPDNNDQQNAINSNQGEIISREANFVQLNSTYSAPQADWLSMVMSPIIPDVESLCLSNSNVQNIDQKFSVSSEVINKVTVKGSLFNTNDK